MTDSNHITITCLGTGTSHGVPMIGCDCPVCTSDDPRDARTRTSVVIECGEASILIDTSPELRLQCVANDIRRVDAVLYTHHHADHVVGLDDLRRFNWLSKSEIPCYAAPETADALQRMFSYAFRRDPDYPSAAPRLTLREIDGAAFECAGVRIIPVPLFHGSMPVLGFRVGKFAYCTDCSLVPDESMELLADLDVLILDALRRTPHPTHFNLEQAVGVARRLGAGHTYFTHIAHELKHAEVCDELPDNMSLAHDGLRLMAHGAA
jgi:phosphoribosyl 1,2-cyclic phosphate phosphodiesterase